MWPMIGHCLKISLIQTVLNWHIPHNLYLAWSPDVISCIPNFNLSPHSIQWELLTQKFPPFLHVPPAVGADNSCTLVSVADPGQLHAHMNDTKIIFNIPVKWMCKVKSPGAPHDVQFQLKPHLRTISNKLNCRWFGGFLKPSFLRFQHSNSKGKEPLGNIALLVHCFKVT